MYRVGLNQNLIRWRWSPAQIALNRSSAPGHKKSLSGDSCASDRRWFSCCTAMTLCNGTDKTREPSSQVPLGRAWRPLSSTGGYKGLSVEACAATLGPANVSLVLLKGPSPLLSWKKRRPGYILN